MTPPRVGTAWSVLGLPDAVVILAGPFATLAGRPEYLVAPLYTGAEPGFVWTSEDVRLEGDETGVGEPRFAAIWNARPMLGADLGLQLGELSEDATIAVKDAYWASLNERPIGPDQRLGKPVRSAADAAAQFQARELERWEPLSARVFDAPLEVSATAVIAWAKFTTFVVADLGAAIQESETLLGHVGISGSGPTMVWLTGAFAIGAPASPAPAHPDLFAQAQDPAPRVERHVAQHIEVHAQSGVSQDTATSELALAA